MLIGTGSISQDLPNVIIRIFIFHFDTAHTTNKILKEKEMLCFLNMFTAV